MVELVDLPRGREIHLGLYLNDKLIKGNDVDDQPKPIVKLPQAREYVGLLSNFVVKPPSEFPIVDVMTM